MKTGFMKMPDYVKKTFEEEKEEEYKPHMMYKGKKKVMAKKKEDHDRLNKQGYDHDNPETKKVEEEKKNCGCGQDPCITYGKGGKKEMKEQSIFEISDALKKRYIAKAGKEVSGKEHMKDYLQRQMDKSNKKTPGTFSGMNKKFVDDKYDKETLKRRKGMAKARAGLKEENKPTNPGLWSKAKAAARSKFDVYPSAYANGWAVQWYKKRGGGWKKVAKEEVELQELSPKTISSYQKKAGKQYSDLKKSTMSATSREGGYHKGYLSQKEYDAQHDMADKKARRGKGLAMSKGKGMRQEQMQLVTNLDLDESIANLVRRGVGKVKDSLQQAGQQYKDSQEKSMKAGKGIYQNPVSGDNIRKRMKQMQSQKKRLTK